MKKFGLVMTVALTAIAMCACGKEASNQGSEPKVETTANTGNTTETLEASTLAVPEVKDALRYILNGILLMVLRDMKFLRRISTMKKRTSGSRQKLLRLPTLLL